MASFPTDRKGDKSSHLISYLLIFVLGFIKPCKKNGYFLITWDVSLEKMGIGFEESVEFPSSVSESCIGNVE